MEQRRNVTEFVLLGLTQSVQGQKILFFVFLLIYTVTMVGNLLIVLTVVFSPTLDAPMYFFLGYLSFMDAVYSTTVTPNMIIDLLYATQQDRDRLSKADWVELFCTFQLLHFQVYHFPSRFKCASYQILMHLRKKFDPIWRSLTSFFL